MRRLKASNKNLDNQIKQNQNKKNWKILTFDEKKKCKQKFQACKPHGCSNISKNELQRMIKQIGKETTQEQLLEMIHQADTKGDGLITYDSFQRMIEQQKIKHYNEITSFVGLTYDAILEQQKIKMRSPTLEAISWQFVKFYLLENFGIHINPKSFTNSHENGKPLSRDDFMNIFS